jgi:sulfide:quinone oxidoreductase
MAAENSGRGVTVAGGGIAALEGVLALRALLADVALEMIAPRTAADYQPLSVLVPFALGEMPELDLTRFATDQRVSLRRDTLVEVRPSQHELRTGGGERLPYEVLLVAAGAQAVEGVPGSMTFRGPGDTRRLGLLFEEYANGDLGTLAFVVPSERAWTLPAYELALLAANTLSARDVTGVEIKVVTAEPAPLASFGPRASGAIADLLAMTGIAVHTATRVERLEKGRLITDGDEIPASRAVALPLLLGPRLAGLPHDENGFIPTDAHGRVDGLDDVYAAGDAIDYPVKQGGLAAQQADAAAESIAARLGAELEPRPFRPVLRGLLLTGLTTSYLEADLSEPERAPAPRPAMFRPSSKVFGHHLLRYLGVAEDVDREAEKGEGIPLELESSGSA